MTPSPRQTVAITGISTITPFSVGWQDTYSAVHGGVPSYEPWSEELSRPFDSARIGLIRNFPKERYFDDRQLRLMDRPMTVASVTAAQAMEDAGILSGDRVENGDNVATVLSSSIAEVPSLYRFGAPLLKQPSRSLNPAHFPMIARNIACGQISIRFGLRGWSTMIAAGEASGAQALARAADLIALGRADAVLVGAYETLAQFSLHQIKARWNKHGRTGAIAANLSNHHVPVEAACFFVLESPQRAMGRGKTPYAVISHCSQGYRTHQSTSDWDALVQRHLRKSPTGRGTEAELHIRAASPCGVEHEMESGLTAAINRRCASSQHIDARADFGDAGAATAMYQTALAAQLLKESGAAAQPLGRFRPARTALMSSVTRSGAFNLLSLHTVQ